MAAHPGQGRSAGASVGGFGPTPRLSEAQFAQLEVELVTGPSRTAGPTSANLVVAPVSNGQVQFYNRSGSVDLIADVEGYVVSDLTTSPGAPGSSYLPIAPTRVPDTRTSAGAAQGTLGAKVAGSSGVPAGAKAVLVNLTGVKPTTSTWLSAYADGSALPGSSTLNLAAGATRANLALVPVGSDGSIDIYNSSGSVNVVADIEGYYIG